MTYTWLFLSFLYVCLLALLTLLLDASDLEHLRKIFVDWTFMHWIMSGYGGVTIFIIGWLIRMQSSHNRANEHIAKMQATNQSFKEDINEIKQDLKDVRGDIQSVNRSMNKQISDFKEFMNQKTETFTRVLQDQKQINNSSEIRVNTLLERLNDEAEKQKEKDREWKERYLEQERILKEKN